MDLSSELITQFAKLTTVKETTKKESTVYGTAVKYQDSMYVKIDGSDLLTPINTTTTIQEGERVLVSIKDHNAIVTGNLSNPSASSSEVVDITNQVKDLKIIVADKVSTTDLEAVNAEIRNLKANKAEISELKATNAEITNLKVNKAEVEDLKATNATIDNLKATKAEVEDLKATNATITSLKSSIANIDTVLAGNISSDNIQTGGITGDNLNMDTIFVRDANIIDLNASKINAGTVNTNLVDIQSGSGNLTLKDNTIQIKDTTRVRVQIGKDASNDYSMSVWDANGKLMFDARGLTEAAIKDSIIRNDMIATDANISGNKLDIDSVITEVNQNGTTTLKSSKVKLDTLGQTLDVAFSSLKTQADDTKKKTESNTTQIGVEQGRINTLIQDTTIEKDGSSLKLKDAYTKTEQTVNGLSKTVGEQASTLTNLSKTVSTNTSSISQLSDSIKTKVEASYVVDAINKIEIGSVNLLEGTSKDFESYSTGQYAIYLDDGTLTLSNTGLKAGDNVTFRVYLKPTTNKGARARITYYYGTDATSNTYNAVYGDIIKLGEEGYSTVTLELPSNITEKGIRVGIQSTDTSTTVSAIGEYKEAKLERGTKATAWSSAQEDIQNKIQEVESSLNNNIDSAVKVARNDLTNEMASNYTSKENFTSYTQKVDSQLEQTAKDITATFNTVNNYTKEVDGKLQEYQNTVSTYIRFSGDGIDIGKTGSPFTSKLDNEKLAFCQDGREVAYISNNKLYITTADIDDQLRIGDNTNGFFIWSQGSNGNLTLKWSDK